MKGTNTTDLDKIEAQAFGYKTKTKRKKDGVFYTPKYITKTESEFQIHSILR